VLKKLTIEDVRDPVVAMAIAMEEKLREHDADRGESGWVGDHPLSLWGRINQETTELICAIAGLVDESGNLVDGKSVDDIRAAMRECADVCNFSMMVHDVLSRLIVDEQRTGVRFGG